MKSGGQTTYVQYILSFFKLLRRNAKGKNKHEEKLCHVKISSITLFSCLKIKHEGKLTAHSVKLTDKLYLDYTDCVVKDLIH